ncbi:MAG TPA: hypothetical protein VGQ59_17995 [Cyclobacteriaceae bacterium]|jgi:hypothetical protein|nr:hypothetical protein [Cyclobacteriaceae bacterium]
MSDMQIKLISQLKKKDSDTWIQGFSKTVLTIILYPLILIFGLLTMIFFFTLSLFQKKEVTVGKSKGEEWTILTEINEVRFLKRFKGDIRFGPAYFEIKTEPTILGLENKIFGDWLFYFEGGLFLQQWNSTDSLNTTLLYVDIEKKQIKKIKDSIPSVLWDLVQRQDKKLELNCDTGDKLLKFEIET